MMNRVSRMVSMAIFSIILYAATLKGFVGDMLLCSYYCVLVCSFVLLSVALNCFSTDGAHRSGVRYEITRMQYSFYLVDVYSTIAFV